MPIDGRVDRDAGLLAQPRLEDGRLGPSIGSHPVDDEDALLREDDHVRATQARHGRDDADPEPPSVVQDLTAVAGASVGGDPGCLRRLAGDVPTDPLLPFGDEGRGVALTVEPTVTGRGHGHDHTTVGMDGHPQAARPRRVSKRVRDRATGQVGHHGPLV